MSELSIVKSDSELAAEALAAALKLRQDAGVPLNVPISIYDLCASMGIEVRFVNISMEGNYLPQDPPIFLVSALRPAVRRKFTTAHELGHHVFGHGFKLDELIETRPSKDKSPEEFVADCFASYLLMPPVAVRKAFARRGWRLSELTPEQAYVVACDFGVGYEAILTQLAVGLQLITVDHFQRLKKTTIPKIEKVFVPDLELDRRLIVMDDKWLSDFIECEVGDYVLVDKTVLPDGDALQQIHTTSSRQPLFRASRRGVTQLKLSTGECYATVRIMGQQFIGLSHYLYLPDPEEDE